MGESAVLLLRFARSVIAALPLSSRQRLWIRHAAFRTLPFLFSRTAEYRAWQAWESASRQSASRDASAHHGAGDVRPVITDQRAPCKAVAFYLPQFHPIPENDEWWGEGFTEWTNVVRARPQFPGHEQPHEPGELGYYDLRDVTVQYRQAALAREHGLYGFCLHHYWFAGTRLLRQPLGQLLAHPDIDIAFCLCWSNENWTRRWDGNEQDILIAQRHSPEDDLAFIRDVAPALADRRYIRIDGRPLLVVYRPELLPDAAATADRWRTWSRQSGIGDLFLVGTQAFERRDPRTFGFDAAMDFAPNNLGAPDITATVPGVSPDFRGVIYDYRYLVDYARTMTPPPYRLFRSVAPMWDNEARRPGRGSIFTHSTPDLYREALESTCRYTQTHLADTPFVFINAWNEWAEGAHLEPDRRHGDAYLRATRAALATCNASTPAPSPGGSSR